MGDHDPSPGTRLRVRDHLPVRLTRLSPEQAEAAADGRLAAAVSGLRATLGNRDATVEELVRGYPPDQRPQGATFDALRLVDAKLNHILHLLEEQAERQDTDGPEPKPVAVSLGELRVGLAPDAESLPQAGEWFWVTCRLPGSPRVDFAAPGKVGEAKQDGEDGRYWVTLALANVTEAEEKVLSEYIFRRHRQEVRQQRHPEG